MTNPSRSPASAASPGAAPVPRYTPPPPLTWRVFFGGVLLPAATWLVEMTSHMCARDIFDPLRTPVHVVMVGLVPVCLLALFVASRKGMRGGAMPSFAAGLTVGTAAFYTLLFVPILPLAVVGLVIGLGILPLSPFFALAASIRATAWARRAGGTWRAWSAGMCVAWLALVAADAPRVWTSVALKRAVSSNDATALDGVRMLRRHADRDLLLRRCYVAAGGNQDLVSSILGLGQGVSHLEARSVYWRVYGEPFNSVPPPRGLNADRWADEGWEWDPDLGGAAVGGRARNLSLAGSRLDASVDADGLTSYTEWTMEFTNHGPRQLEARAELALPTGGVVSRATLWVDGTPREGIIASRVAARAAYEKVVRQRRDPLLVTSSGPDRVLVQCFPVQPGNTMKIRVGITAPPRVLDERTAQLALPRLVQRNFNIAADVMHSVWVESRQPMTRAGALVPEERDNGVHALRGDVANAQLANVLVTLERDASITTSWTADPVEEGRHITQVMEQRPGVAPGMIALVVDGSRSMAGHADALKRALEALPIGANVGVWLAGDTVREIVSPAAWSADSRARLASVLSSTAWVGGQDNFKAVLAAARAAERARGVVVWVHGPQPEGSIATLMGQLSERSDHPPAIIDVAITDGANELGNVLAMETELRRLDAVADPHAALRSLFESFDPGQQRWVLSRRAGGVATGKETSAHLARLWAADEVARLLAQKPPREQDALAVSVRYGLVTSVSGAVVLETAAAEKAEGLVPGDPSMVPAVPEPTTWALIMVIATVLAWQHRRRSACA